MTWTRIICVFSYDNRGTMFQSAFRVHAIILIALCGCNRSYDVAVNFGYYRTADTL